MISSPTSFASGPTTARPTPLRIGFIPLNDAAPVVAAQELSLFRKHGLRVALSREVGWATIREKVIYGEIDGAHCPAPMLWSTHLGLESVPCPVLTGLVLSRNGNALTLSERLWDRGIRDASSLREDAKRRTGENKLTFGVVFSHSSHHLLLRAWLRSGGLDPVRDVRIVVVPPAQMFRNLLSGTLDGYCSGEPWNTLAVREKIGWCPTWSTAQSISNLEKVLMVTARFAAQRPEEHSALIAALLEACTWCDEPTNREALAEMLSGAAYLNQSAHIIRPSLLGQFDCGHQRVVFDPDFHVFQRQESNRPRPEEARVLQNQLVEAGLLPARSMTDDLPRTLFRTDLYLRATSIHYAALSNAE